MIGRTPGEDKAVSFGVRGQLHYATLHEPSTVQPRDALHTIRQLGGRLGRLARLEGCRLFLDAQDSNSNLGRLCQPHVGQGMKSN